MSFFIQSAGGISATSSALQWRSTVASPKWRKSSASAQHVNVSGARRVASSREFVRELHP